MNMQKKLKNLDWEDLINLTVVGLTVYGVIAAFAELT